MEVDLLKWLTEQAPAVLILAILLWMVGKRYFTAMDKRVEEIKSHSDGLMSAADKQIEDLKVRADQCDRRHRATEERQAKLHDRILELFSEKKS